MRVDGEHGKLRLLQRLRTLVGRFLEQHTEARLEVDGQARAVLAAQIQTVAELQRARLHDHLVGRGGQHVAGDQFEAYEAAGSCAL